jgi:3-isopropylmalate dehydrogenase
LHSLSRRGFPERLRKKRSMAKTYHIGVIPGDGTGPEVMREAAKSLRAVARTCGIGFKFTEFVLGGDPYIRDGTLLPDEVVDELRTLDAVLLGAIGHPDVTPGILEREILLKLRFELDLYINLRPIALLPGVAGPLRDKGPEDIDFVVVRENTEGLYAGGGGFFKRWTPDEVALQESISTRKGVERCIRYAFEYCRKRNKKRSLLLCGKKNVLLYESDLWDRIFQEVAQEYAGVETGYQHVDALCMWLVKNPEQYDVIVTTNMFGDIITDIGAALQGGLGVAAGANINPEGAAVFEPIGGSAPKYAGQDKINPLAAISAAQMMLDFLGEAKAAQVLDQAVRGVARNELASLEAGKMGFGTRAVGDLVVRRIEENGH